MKSLGKIIVVSLIFAICLTGCKKETKIQANMRKLQENEERYQSEQAELENTTTDEVISYTQDDVGVDIAFNEDDILYDNSETNEESVESLPDDMVEGILSQDEMKSIAEKYITATNETFESFLDEYCLNRMSILSGDICISCSMNYCALEMDANQEDYSYLVSAFVSYENTSIDYVLRFNMYNNKISSVDLLQRN